MKLKLKTVLMSVKAEVSLQGKYRGTLDILHLLKKKVVVKHSCFARD